MTHHDRKSQYFYIVALRRCIKYKFINESGLYSLILFSKLESAKRFKHWVTSEVLLTICKRGACITNKKLFEFYWKI